MIRERLHAVRDNVEVYASASATATIYILDAPSKKRQANPNSGDVIQDSCAQSQAAGTFSECTLTDTTPTSSTTGTQASTTGTVQTTTGTMQTTTNGSAPAGIAVALLLCFVASFLMTVM
jgi:hypothetical protein